MKDIGVSMRQDILEHKKRDGMLEDDCFCYWTTRLRINNDVSVGSRLWVASKGRWVGFFVIHDIEEDEGDYCEIRFYSDTWFDYDGGERKPFQGFTYKVPELSREIGPMVYYDYSPGKEGWKIER